MKDQDVEEKRRLDWHSGFEGGLRLSLRKYASALYIEREHPLSDEPLRIDFLVVRKTEDVVIDNALGRCFLRHNIIEYKNPDDELDIDVVWKTIGYAGLYKSFGKTVNEIKICELTITVIRATRPAKLLNDLTVEGKNVSCTCPGIYRIEGLTEIALNIVVINELKDRELLALSIMRRNAKEEEVREFLAEAGSLTESGDKRNADAVLQICAGANANLFARLRGDKRMCEALREIMAEDLKEAEDKGTERVNALNRILIDAGRIDDLTKATLDPNYQKELIKELVPAGKQ